MSKGNRQLNDELRSKAISCGLCNEWQGLWRKDWTEEKMVNMFYRGIDFFFDKRFISNNFIKQRFSSDFLHSNGVLVDEKRSMMNMRHVCILGESDATLRYNGESIGEVYVADNSRLHLTARNNSFVIVRMIGNAQADIEKKDSARVKVIRHDDTTTVKASDGVIVADELDWPNKDTTA